MRRLGHIPPMDILLTAALLETGGAFIVVGGLIVSFWKTA